MVHKIIKCIEEVSWKFIFFMFLNLSTKRHFMKLKSSKFKLLKENDSN